MKVSGRTLAALADIVLGNNSLGPYRGGNDLVHLFNEFGANDVYGSGFPSRGPFAQQKLRALNDTPELAALITEVLHPGGFIDHHFDHPTAIDYLNQRLRYDGYEVAIDGRGLPVVRTLDGSMVSFVDPLAGTDDDARRFLDEQRTKCDQKIREGDFDGAVTNARTMLETVLTDIERALNPNPPDYDGDLGKLYKRVQKLLKLEPARPDLDTPLKQVLTGLASVVSGIARVSNKMGDRHVRTYAPKRRHAVLVVDSAKTLASFLVSTYRDQNPT
jgi:hypothetical protein